MRERARPWPGAVAALALYAVLVPWLLRPWFLGRDLFPHMEGPVGSLGDADLYLNIWILAWIAHALVHAPAALLDGNIYYPAPGAVLGSENMLAHVPFTAPALEWTGSALAMLKAYALESFALSGLGGFLYVRYRTRSWAAGLLAGALLTCTVFRVRTIPQPQYLGIAGLPLAFLFTDLWLERRRATWLAALGAAVAAQALGCVYVGFFTFATVPVYAAFRIRWRSARPLAAAAGVAAALAGAALALLPVAIPYARARSRGVIPVHDLAWVQVFSWPLSSYLSWSFVERVGALTLIVVGSDLALRALGLRCRAWRAEKALWAVAGAAALLALGPALALPGGIEVPLPYRLLYELVPGFSSIRAPLRFTIVVAAALALLAGLAYASRTARWPRPARGAVALALALAAAGLAAPRPSATMRAGLGASAPPVYRWLASRPDEGAVLEIPAGAIEDDPIGNLRNGRYMVASTIHWRPLVNGYTAYPPPAAQLLGAAIRELPSRDALARLVATSGLRWVVLHRRALSPEERRRWDREPIEGLERVARFGRAEVYEVRVSAAADWREAVRAGAPAGRTLEGTPIAALAPACRRAEIAEIRAPRSMLAIPSARRVEVRLSNPGPCPWPAVAPSPRGLVALTYRWISPAGERTRRGPRSSLLHDVAPGASVRGSLLVRPPRGRPGRWRLRVELAQDGLDPPLASREVEVLLEPPPPAPGRRALGGAAASARRRAPEGSRRSG